jgi:glycosyltransferase involved in cell wall biosynthesis
MLTFSVALATYNGQKYLNAQLNTISDQTAAPSELVVADDGSSDDTINILREFAETAPFPVRIIQNQSRLGYRTNFMQAAAACNSDLIAFCDQDDIWDLNKFRAVQNAFDDPNVLLAYHNATLIDETGAAIGKTFRKRHETTLSPLTMRPWTIIPGHAQVVRRSLVRFTSLHSHSIDPYSPAERMPHDQWYPFWASVLGDIVYNPDPLAHYRQHGANASGWPANLIAFILDHVSNAEAYVEANAFGAKNRLELLHRSRDMLTRDEVARVDAAIPYYEALCIESDQRLAVYKGKTLAPRVRMLLSLLRQGAYTGKTLNSIGLDALLLDACIGIPSVRLGRSGGTSPQTIS